VFFVALAFAAKENAIVYVLCWLGAGALLVDAALFRPRDADSGWQRLREGARDRWNRYVTTPGGRRRIGVGAGHLVGAAFAFVLVFVFFHAPRGGDAGLWTGNLGATLETTVSDVQTGYEYWFGHGEEKSIAEYRDTLEQFVGTTLRYAAPLFLLAIAGFLLDRYDATDRGGLVAFCGLWGFASVVGYPLGTDIWGAWIVVNALVPLSVPAAVALARIVEAGRDAIATDDRLGAGVAVVVLLLAVGQVAVVGVPAVYGEPTSPDNGLVQFAQPQQEMRPAIDATVTAAAANADGPDALFYGGEAFVDMDDSDLHTPACLDWFNTLPWGWYLEADDVEVTCARSSGGLPASTPPVVVAAASCPLEHPLECRERPGRLQAVDDLGDRLPDSYERYGFLHRTTGGNDFAGMVVFVDDPS
jgi:uncharacterized protein (TIGR03663 family)